MTRRGIERTLAGLAAIIGWAGLALQYWLAVQAFGTGGGTSRFLAFFTTFAGIGAALVATAVASGSKGALASRMGIAPLTRAKLPPCAQRRKAAACRHATA